MRQKFHFWREVPGWKVPFYEVAKIRGRKKLHSTRGFWTLYTKRCSEEGFALGRYIISGAARGLVACGHSVKSTLFFGYLIEGGSLDRTFNLAYPRMSGCRVIFALFGHDDGRPGTFCAHCGYGHPRAGLAAIFTLSGYENCLLRRGQSATRTTNSEREAG